MLVGATSTGLDANLAAALTYAVGWVTGLAFYFIEPDNKFVRFHAVQSTIEAAATTVGEVAGILTQAVRDVATAIGGFATEVFEIREAARRAAEDGTDQPIPSIEQQLDE